MARRRTLLYGRLAREGYLPEEVDEEESFQTNLNELQGFTPLEEAPPPPPPSSNE
jgi:hypothetical protein